MTEGLDNHGQLKAAIDYIKHLDSDTSDAAPTMFARNLLLLCLHLFSVAVAQAPQPPQLPQLPPPAAPGTDACGPFDHRGDAGFSTCDTSVVPGGPKAYGIVCGSDNSIPIQTKTTPCARAAQGMCTRLVEGDLKTGGWEWSKDSPRATCRIGIFISNIMGAAPVPNYKRCLNQIFAPMIQGCFRGGFNIATVNLAELPDFTTNFSGRAVNEGYHAYVVSPRALFYSTDDPNVTPGVFGDPGNPITAEGPNNGLNGRIGI